MLNMYTKFEIGGVIRSAQVRQSKNKPDNYYGQIEVACGDCLHEFFVDTKEVEADKYPTGAEVFITGTIGKRGFNVNLKADSITVGELVAV